MVIMKLSIIIPYYNADKWIGRMLDSLLNQNLDKDEYEIIVVDDGSKDEPVILQDYVCRYSNISYIRQENGGPGTARNTGISAATGEYIFFCDSDDYIAENVLGILYDIAHERELDMLFHNRIKVNDSYRVEARHDQPIVIDEYVSGQQFFGLPIDGDIITGVWIFIIRRAFLERNKIRFPSGIMNEDSSFYIDAIMSSGKVAKTNLDVYFYVQNPQSLLHFAGLKQQAERHVNDMLQFVQKLTIIIKDEKLAPNMPSTCLDNLKWLRNQKACIMLANSCRFLSASKTRELTTMLKVLGVYPTKVFGTRHKLIKIIMNNPFMWKVFYTSLSVLPSSLRKILL